MPPCRSGSAFGRKFLGYSLWVGRGKVVKLKVAGKPLAGSHSSSEFVN